MKAMTDPYDDDALIAALKHARGYDRELLVGGLGSSHGSDGAAVLRRLTQPDSGEDGHIRGVAIEALSRRTGSDDTPVYARALRDRSTVVQTYAALALADVGDERAAEDFLKWLVRKLRRKTRADTWDPEEVPSVVRYAARNHVLTQTARVLAQHVGMLQYEERRWLWETWPDVLGKGDTSDDIAPPKEEELREPVFAESAPTEDDGPEDYWGPMRRDALARAQRRERRASKR